MLGNYVYAEVKPVFLGPVSAASTSSGWRSWGYRTGAAPPGCRRWDVADISMGLRGDRHLIAIVLLGKWAFAALRNYHSQAEAGEDPEFIAEEAALPGRPEGDIWTRSARSSLV